MNLFREIISFADWMIKIGKVYLQVRPITTTVVIVLTTLGNISRLLSFILPLKVLILAGSHGVPKYFPFINPVDKSAWIVGLSFLALASYFLALTLENLVKNISFKAGSDVAHWASKMIVLNNQRETSQEFYSSFSSIWANILFLGVSFLVLLWINIQLTLFLTLLYVILFVFTAWAISGQDFAPGPLKSFIEQKTGNYLNILSSITFLSSFLVILIPFLSTSKGNMLSAIISIVLIRRCLSFAVGTIKTSVRLIKAKHKLNTLVFPDIQFQKNEDKHDSAFRDLFSRYNRQLKIEEELAKVLSFSGPVEVFWTYSSVRQINKFIIKVHGLKDRADQLFQLKVFAPGAMKRLENEDYLFKYVDRERLNAPELIARFEHGCFQCCIYDYHQGLVPSAGEWNISLHQLLRDYWTYQPDEHLVKAFHSSHMPMHKRLNPELAGKVEIAVDSDDQAEVLRWLIDNLPEICGKIAMIPLYINNSAIRKRDTVKTRQGKLQVMTWGKWSLDPVGIIIPNKINMKSIIDTIGLMQQFRSDVPSDFDVGQLHLAGLCHKLERKINNGLYKSALEIIRELRLYSGK